MDDTKEDEVFERYCIEHMGRGYIVCDYSGKRGRFGSAFFGTTGVWHEQPLYAKDVFDTEEQAKQAIIKLKNES